MTSKKPSTDKIPQRPNPHPEPPAKEQLFQALEELMRHLRCPHHGCAWDRKQTMASIVPYTIEEAYEVQDAVNTGDPQALKDELADLLFHVVYFSELASEQGAFDFTAVAKTLYKKILRRHPHVFDNRENLTEAEVVGAWQKIKAKEREVAEKGYSALDGVAKTLPATLYAQKIQQRARHVGFDWPEVSGVYDKIEEELVEVKEAVAAQDKSAMAEEVGDLMFACVNLARFCEVSPEVALAKASEKFETRFRAMESKCLGNKTELANLSLEEMEQLWQEVKGADEVV